MPQLEGKVAIITGAGRGIGQAVARLFAREGARIVAVGRTLGSLQETVGLIEKAGGQALAVTGDVGEKGAAEKVVQQAVARFGQVDILVNNAAVIGPVQPLGQDDVDEWIDTLRINVVGPYLMTRAVVPVMKKAGRGKIVDVNSAANRGTGGNLVPYRVSKAALIRLTNALADQLLPAGIEVNTFDAHATTPMVHEMAKWDAQDPALAARFRQRLKNGEPTPEQNAEYCLWLASSRSDGMSGRNVAWWMDLADLDRLKPQIIADPRALRMDMVEVPGVRKTAWAEEYDKRRFAPAPQPAKK